MIRISPSVLNANQDDLSNEVSRVAPTADFIHLDIMDGIFVPNFTYDEDETLRIVGKSVLPIDLHLMVADADHWGPRYAQMRDDGVFSVTIHLEATRDIETTLQEIGASGVRRGLAIKPKTEVKKLMPFLNQVDMVLIMTVEPGFGGQSFMPEMMPKVKETRKALAEMGRETTWIQVDGGIALNTIDVAVIAGADTFVAGSAVYGSEDPASAVRALRTRAQQLVQ